MDLNSSTDHGIPPKELQKDIWLFPSNGNRDSTSAWWVGCEPEPVLIDCPLVTPCTIESLKTLSKGKLPLIILTNRGSHGEIASLQSALDWPILVQEQEAYLLPAIKHLDTFSESHETKSGLKLLWTPGPTPGSCVVYAPTPWNVLFCGRLLIPKKFNCLATLPSRTNFHWGRYQKSVEKVRDWVPRDPRPSLASGASLSVLGERKLVDWEAWRQC